MSKEKLYEIKNPKLTDAENSYINEMIRGSWRNGRIAGRKGAFAELYKKGILKGRKS